MSVAVRSIPWTARAAAMVELTKPRLASLVLFVVYLGAFLAGDGGMVAWHAVLGTFLVAGGANALNQVLERDLDRRMRRTRERPLPTGRLTTLEAAIVIRRDAELARKLWDVSAELVEPWLNA